MLGFPEEFLNGWLRGIFCKISLQVIGCKHSAKLLLIQFAKNSLLLLFFCVIASDFDF